MVGIVTCEVHRITRVAVDRKARIRAYAIDMVITVVVPSGMVDGV